MMRVIDPTNILDIKDECHYTVDVSKLEPSTAVVCPFDNNMKIGRNENGVICITKKSWFRPFSQK